MEVDDNLKHLDFEVLVDFLLESNKCPTDILNSDPHPSYHTLALFAAVVYMEKEPGETDEVYNKRLNLPKGWCLLVSGSNSSRTNGYFGAAFVNTEFQQVVVAHRGTISTNPGALFTDIVGICGTQYTGCMNSAVTFTELIRQVIFFVNTQHGRSYNLVITGHSLGGWLAQITTFTIKCVNISDGALMRNTSGGFHAKTVVFDSPGAKIMLEKIRDDYYDRFGTNILDRLDITVYFLAPNRINTFGEHLGLVCRFLIDMSNFNTSLFYSNETHAMSNFVNSFRNNSGIKKVLDWPKNSNEYNSLFGKYALNPANNYHTEFGEDTYDLFLFEKTKRYNTEKIVMDKCYFNVFSDNELQILKQLIIIQKQENVGVINKFISNKKFELKNEKLFPEFEIDYNNRTVSCKSELLLGTFTKRLKQLMRWLELEFTVAVEEQIAALPRAVDSFYQFEGQIFLDSLPKSTLNFTDSFGLQNFLLSDTVRVLSIVTQDGAFEMTRLQNIFSQIKEIIHSSVPNNKYSADGHYTFLDWPRLQELYKIYGSPIDQNDLLIVDGSSSSFISLEVITFLNNYIKFSSAELKKLVFISSQQFDTFNSFECIKTFKADRKINLMDLSEESQKEIFKRNIFTFTGNKRYSFHRVLGDNCSIQEINKIVSSECFQNIVINEDYFINIKDTRPRFSDLQMLVFKTNIKTNIEYILSCVESPNTLVVMSGLSLEELETGASWVHLKGKNIILAEEDVELSFKNTCNINEHKSIYLFEVSDGDVYCKQIFNRDFYLPRKFFHRAGFDLLKFIKTKHCDELLVCVGPFLGSSGNYSKERVMLSECNALVVTTKEEEVDIIKKNFNKNVHFVKFEKTKSEEFELEWQYSHGSVDNLRLCVSMDSGKPIDELTLSQTERNLVILTDEPGMGKSTSLACLSRHFESSWVIYIELKNFQAHIDRLSNDFNIQNVANFLLSECHSSADGSVPRKLLENLLQSHMCSKRIVLMFDGFDELDDFNQTKESSKEKLVRLFAFLVNKPTVQIFLTSRKYLKELLEVKLSHLSTSFLAINAEEQQHFLFMFWRSCLSLELENYGEEEERRLKEYARKLLEEAKRVLGSDMDCFMGVPLQLKMLAEVFRPQSDMFVQSPEVWYEKINIVSAPNLYKMFIKLKYDIYLQDKTLKSKTMDEHEIEKYLEFITEKHGELGFKTFFSNFFEENFDDIEDEWLTKLNRYGLVHSKSNGEFQFIHRTFAEYCCAQVVVQWLNQRDSHFRYPLVKEILLPQILLHPDRKIIRLFMNVELNEIPMAVAALKLNAQHIAQMWLEDNSVFRNQEHQTALHIAVQERNENIVSFLLSGINIDSTQEAFTSFITQYDINSNTALNIVDLPAISNKGGNNLSLNRIMTNILECFQTCCIETKENIFFACLFNGDVSNSFVSNYLRESSDLNCETLKVFDRVKEVKLEMISFVDAVLEKNVILAREILYKRLKNNIERYGCLLMKQKHHGMKSVLHLAAQQGHIDIVEVLAEQTSVPFAVLMEQRDDNKQTPLHTAAACGHLNIIKYLKKRGAYIDTCCELGKTALMHAVCFGDIACVKYLIKSSANINSVGDDGKTALHEAANKGYLSIVEHLVDSGADINTIDNIGPTVLNCAAQGGHLSVVEYLVKSGANIRTLDKDGATAFLCAAREGHLSVVEYLNQSCADNINSLDIIDRSALYYAAQEGRLPVTEFLVKNGADMFSSDAFGNSALHVAAEQGHVTVVEYLVKSGASTNMINNDCNTVLHVAAEEGNLPVVECLVKNGANINVIRYFDRRTALFGAVINGHLLIVEYLVKSGADINYADIYGYTVIHAAVTEDQLPVVEYLVTNGADIYSIDSIGSTALHVAAGQGHLSIVEYLVKSGANINSVNNDGESALIGAVTEDHLPVVEYLVKKGADINSKDRFGITVLRIAAANGHLKVIEYLVKSGAIINFADDRRSAIHEAAEGGHFSVVEYLVKSGADVSSVDENGKTALYYAVEEGHLPIEKFLVENGANKNSICKDRATEQNPNIQEVELFNKSGYVNSLHKNGINELCTAAQKGCLPAVEHLVRRGVGINSRENDDKTALYVAAQEGHLPVVEFLVKNGAYTLYPDDHINNPLRVAAKAGHLSVVEFLNKNGATIISSHLPGDGALDFAVQGGHLPVVKFLLSNCAIMVGKTLDTNRSFAFFQAAHCGHLPIVEYLIESGTYVNSIDKDGSSALHYAAEAGHLSVIQYLVKNRGNVNSKDKYASTVLHTAAKGGHIPVVEYLVKRSDNIHFADKDGWSALSYSANKGHLPVVEYLIKSGANVNSKDNNGCTALYLAAEDGHLPVIEYLDKSGANVNSTDNEGCTPLYVAAQEGHLPVVEYLIKNGANVNSIENEGCTPLYVAAQEGHLPVVEYLIQNGANVNSIDNEGCTPLYVAAQEGHLPVVEYLIQNGANVNSIDNEGCTPLNVAVQRGHLPIVEYLIQNGANVNSIDNEGCTPLYVAAQEGHLPVVEYLIQNGANVNSIENEGCTPLFVAAQEGHLPVVEYLIQNGANVNSIDNESCTPLYVAAQEGHLPVVEYLIQNGANVNSIDSEGCTALHGATLEGYFAIVKYLVKSGTDVNSADNYGNTALINSADEGHLCIVLYLVECDANLKFKDNNGCTALSKAADKGHLPIVKCLIKSGSDDINSIDNDDRTALHYAANAGHILVVEYLLQAGADLHCKDIYGCTALYGAAKEGNYPIVRHLVTHGANLKSKNDDGCTALYVAASNGHLLVVICLIVNDSDINSTDNDGCTALYGVAEKNQLPVVQLLVKNNINVNSIDNNGRSVLFVAAYGGLISVVEYLIKNGADINTVDNEGCTVLYPATQEGHLPIVEYLIKNGADVNSKDNDGRTVLHYAASQGNLPVVEYLVKNGADVESMDNSGRTGLYPAALEGHLPVVEYLVVSCTDMKGIFNGDKTALHGAAKGGHLSVVKYLLRSGADINLVDNESKTALYRAAAEGHLPIVQYLVSVGADVKCTSVYNGGKTALHEAFIGGHIPIVEYLLEQEVYSDKVDKWGRPVLTGSSHWKNNQVDRGLLERGVEVNADEEIALEYVVLNLFFMYLLLFILGLLNGFMNQLLHVRC